MQVEGIYTTTAMCTPITKSGEQCKAVGVVKRPNRLRKSVDANGLSKRLAAKVAENYMLLHLHFEKYGEEMVFG
jgi:hypothetical protein